MARLPPLQGSMPFSEFTRLLDCALGTSRSIETYMEDLNLLPLLRWAAGGQPGTFVELGANDGKSGSMTYVLENCFNWRGVLIEGNPVMCHEKLLPGTELQRPGSQKFCAAVQLT